MPNLNVIGEALRAPAASWHAWRSAILIAAALAASSCGDNQRILPKGDGECGTIELAFPVVGGAHVPVCSPVTYNSNPPTSGPHYPNSVTLAKEPRLRYRDAATMRMAVLTAMTEIIESTPPIDAATMLPLYAPFLTRALRGESWPSQTRSGNISEHAFTQRTVTDPAMRAVAHDTLITPAFTAPNPRRWRFAVGAGVIGLGAAAILFVALRQHSTEPTVAPPTAPLSTTKPVAMPSTIPPIECGGMHQLPLECATLRHFTAQFSDCAGLRNSANNLQTMVDEMIARMCKEAAGTITSETTAMMASSCMMTLDSYRAMAKEANCAIAR